jgi:hypothetical protein
MVGFIALAEDYLARVDADELDAGADEIDEALEFRAGSQDIGKQTNAAEMGI